MYIGLGRLSLLSKAVMSSKCITPVYLLQNRWLIHPKMLFCSALFQINNFFFNAIQVVTIAYIDLHFEVLNNIPNTLFSVMSLILVQY